jgi:crotonobetainyl-CoA:carnitine CoA-transferase CaiB-like acyl-CoA transferase
MKTNDKKTSRASTTLEISKLKDQLKLAQRKAARTKLTARAAKATYKKVKKEAKAARKAAKAAHREVLALREALADAEGKAAKAVRSSPRAHAAGRAEGRSEEGCAFHAAAGNFAVVPAPVPRGGSVDHG